MAIRTTRSDPTPPVAGGRTPNALARAFGKGRFPHHCSWLIDNPIRAVLVTPKKLADRLQLTEENHVLELGPGSGYFSVELARRIPLGRLELLDVQPQMLQKAERKLNSRGLRNVGYTAHDAGTDLPFPDQTFDVAVMVAVLGEVSDAETCLRELRRVLRRGGVLAVHEQIPDPDRIAFGTLRSLAEGGGFVFRKRWGPNWNYTAIFERAAGHSG